MRHGAVESDMVRITGIVLAMVVLCAVSGCSGGSAFTPASGPFAGVFMASGAPTGQFTLTYTEGLIGGTGSLTVNGDLVPVSISAVLQGERFSGTITNVNLGNGTISGVFNDRSHISGTFRFEDTAQTVLLEGTYVAVAPAN
jgi:hypothetical protein